MYHTHTCVHHKNMLAECDRAKLFVQYRGRGYSNRFVYPLQRWCNFTHKMRFSLDAKALVTHFRGVSAGISQQDCWPYLNPRLNPPNETLPRVSPLTGIPILWKLAFVSKGPSGRLYNKESLLITHSFAYGFKHEYR